MSVNISFSALSHSDISECLDIEFDSYEFPWERDDFTKCIIDRCNLCIRDYDSRRILAYMFFAPDDEGGVEILNVCVHKDYRRKKLATKLIELLMKNKKYTHIYTSVRETNLGAQILMRSLGLKCVNILKRFYDNIPDEPAYFFSKEHLYDDTDGVAIVSNNTTS